MSTLSPCPLIIAAGGDRNQLFAHMAEPKTTRTNADVDEFLDSVENDTRRRDAFAVKDLMADVTGEQPDMWGNAIVGYGP